MDVKPIRTPSFKGYSNLLKTYFKEGKLPSVKKGFYGGALTCDNVTLEHLETSVKNGPTIIGNLVLAVKDNNISRGCKNIKEVFKKESAVEYLLQFFNVKVGEFDGNKYIASILERLNKLGINL